MGTNSLTIFEDIEGKEIVRMYRHGDGMPEMHGKQLAELLSGIRMVKAVAGRDTNTANGMACLVAQVIAHFKTGVGEIYLHAANEPVDSHYIYRVFQGADGDVCIECTDPTYHEDNETDINLGIVMLLLSSFAGFVIIVIIAAIFGLI